MLETLPLWLRHGEVVWLPTVVGVGLATLFARRRRARGLVAREAAKSRQSLGEPGKLESGVVTVSGTLRVESGAGAAPAEGDAVVSSHRDIKEQEEGRWRLVLDVAGTPVEIPRANVVAGSRETKLESGAILRHLCAGDATRARGRAERSGADDGGYRAEPGWRLVADVGTDDAGKRDKDRAYVPLAFEGAPRRPLPRALGVRAGIVGTVACLALAWLLGWAALDVSEGLLLRTPDSRFAAALIEAAAAMPLHHKEALEKLAEASMPHATASRLGRYATLERELDGNCDHAQQWLADHGHLEPMLALANECPSPTTRRLAARAALLDGRIKQARELLQNNPAPDDEAGELWLDAVVTLLARDMPAAAAAVRRLSEVGIPHKGFRFDDAQRAALQCVAFWAEQPTSKAEHSQLEKTAKHNATCSLLLYDRIDDPGDAGAKQVLMDIDHETPPARLVDLRDALALEVGAEQRDVLRLPPALPADVALGHVALEDFDHWLAPSALAYRAKDPVPHEARGRLALEHALALSAVGAFDDADHWLDLAGTELEAADPDRNAHLVERLPLWRVAITARRGDFRRAAKELATVTPNPRDAEPRKELQGVIEYATTGELSGLQGDAGDLAVSRPALDIARKGGGPLVAFLETLPRRVAMATALLAAPRLRTGRDALVGWLDRDATAEVCPVFCRLDALVADTASRAVALRALGKAKRASALQARARRLQKLVGQRRTAVPLAILQML